MSSAHVTSSHRQAKMSCPPALTRDSSHLFQPVCTSAGVSVTAAA